VHFLLLGEHGHNTYFSGGQGHDSFSLQKDGTQLHSYTWQNCNLCRIPYCSTVDMFAPCEYPEILGDEGKKETYMGRTSGMGVGGGRERGDSEQTLNILTEQSSTQGRQVQESQILYI
jgi:hypothetical protein